MADAGREGTGSMATKVAIVNGDDRQIKRRGANPVSKILDWVVEQWKEFSQFLSDVRAEMRKVVTPSWKEVKSTTTVVIIAVFIFGVYFFVVDAIFQYGLHAMLGKLGGF
ncbi:MAG: preprotein translocase subunit SecE [Terracidiphilus sp.]|jgi:preprotein translocase subunit SecE